MKEWFAKFNQREQLSLILLASAVACYLLYFAVWAPLAQKQDDMAARNVKTAASLQNVDSMASEILRLRDSGTAVSQKRNLTSLINRSSAALSLPVTRLQPNSRGEIQVRLENAVFDDLLQWLHEMEYVHSLMVLEASLTQSSATGRVNASIRIAQGA
ncbi:MAG: type II secretion system protein GspM [Halioglobus sp.]